MKRAILFILALGIVQFSDGATMTFAGGAAETGFSFSGFGTDNSTIWIANLGNTPGKITKSSGRWNVTSVLLGTPLSGSSTDNFTITSSEGDSYSYTGATSGTITLNWNCVSWIQFHRVSCCSGGSVGGTSPDIDNIVYTIPTGPTTPSVTHTPSTLCSGDNVTLNISGTLNDATSWVVYSGGCGSGSSIASTSGSSVTFASTSSTTYYVRGEGCGFAGACGNRPVTVTTPDDASFSYSQSSYCTNDTDPTPSAATTGTYSSSFGLAITLGSGLIDVSSSTPGSYTVGHTTTGTCPSSSNVSITIGGSSTSSVTTSTCNMYVAPSGKVLTTTATHLDTIPNDAGCDSIISINLTINQTSSSISPTVCQAYTSPGGKTKTSTETFNDTLTNAAGCDSVITIFLTVNSATTASISPDVCNTYTSPSGKVKTATETFNDTIPNTAGCDSVITINLTVRLATSSSISPDVCNSYTSPSGKVKTSSVTFNDTISNDAMCDSVITITLTVRHATSSTISPDVCNTYTSPSGAVKTSSESFNDTISNTASCDSVITINLTVRHATSATISPDVCNTYTSPSGAVKTSSENFNDTISNTASCDSVITINLTVRHATSSSISPDVCDSYTSPSGKAKTATETFNDTIPNAASCDSVITITLTVRKSSTHTITLTAIDTFTMSGGQKVIYSGTYIDTIANDAGCDSITTYNITITNRIRVDGGIAVSGTGDSWSQAFKTIEEALECVNVCNSEAEIWVKAGTYTPRNLPHSNRNSTFLFTNINVRFLGGFNGTESSASARNPATNVTILSGDIGVIGDASDNIFHVVIIQDKRGYTGGEEVMNSDFNIDGFTISGGNANGGGRYGHNGMYVYEHSGGGVFIISRGAGREISPLISNCTFTNNYAAYGSAVYANVSAGLCSATIDKCIFTANRGLYGTVYNDGKEGNVSPTISNCVFDNNLVFSSGAAIYNKAYLGTASPIVKNVVFSNNLALSAGGCIYSDGYKGVSSATIFNSTFFNNTAGSFGGAIANYGSNGTCAPTATNCIFNNNKAASDADHKYSEFYNINATTTVSYSSLHNPSTLYTAPNFNSLNSGSNNIFGQDPSFTSTTDLDGSDNLWRTADDGLMPASGSPVINAGTTTGAPTTDIRGASNSGNKDMGAYEVGGVVVP